MHIQARLASELCIAIVGVVEATTVQPHDLAAMANLQERGWQVLDLLNQ